jgi:hypothetical protein
MTTGATQLAVFYATGSKILRRKIIPDSDAQLALHQPGPGESLVPAGSHRVGDLLPPHGKPEQEPA